ncbi:hypothetical protein J4Q44_G00282110 [Coregonus suidteri]|uniref:Uncharacterized protein n=1 Tax=Coregonus suidteri TaxID=861788 RepID=A0AAN8L1Y7_9TELE
MSRLMSKTWGKGDMKSILMHLQIQCFTQYCIIFDELLTCLSTGSICCSLHNQITMAQDVHAPGGLWDALLLDWKTKRHLSGSSSSAMVDELPFLVNTVPFLFPTGKWQLQTRVLSLGFRSAHLKDKQKSYFY